jgi:hypothetical protein
VAEAVVIVCDVCGKAPANLVSIRANGTNRVKDLCAAHLRELLEGTRAPKRGRRPGATVSKATAKKRPGRPRKATGATRKPVPAKRRGRPRKRAAA